MESEAAIRESEGGSEYCIVVRDTLAAGGGQGSMVSGGRKDSNVADWIESMYRGNSL